MNSVVACAINPSTCDLVFILYAVLTYLPTYQSNNIYMYFNIKYSSRIIKNKNHLWSVFA